MKALFLTLLLGTATLHADELVYNNNGEVIKHTRQVSNWGVAPDGVTELNSTSPFAPCERYTLGGQYYGRVGALMKNGRVSGIALFAAE
jgi:hypothetical protein